MQAQTQLCIPLLVSIFEVVIRERLSKYVKGMFRRMLNSAKIQLFLYSEVKNH